MYTDMVLLIYLVLDSEQFFSFCISKTSVTTTFLGIDGRLCRNDLGSG